MAIINIKKGGWYSFVSKGEPVADADRAWSRDFQAREICLECGTRKPEYSDQPVNVVLDGEPINAPLVYPSVVPATLMRIDLLNVLGAFMEPHFRLGTVIDASGHPYPDFVTYTAARRLPLRGDERSLLGTCPVCGHIRYYPMPFGKEYIVRASMSPSLCVYYPDPGALLARGDIVSRIPFRIRRKFHLKEIPVVDEPRDGIEDFPPVRCA